ncbi:hypothetical protein [Streptacidiphilus albus]|uniref:hypothetical protein n=1 Tax=Streptacidiphilus albus TaxID=105425 RepID=UPI00054BB1B4|nr:hypothetical protein [Streptacidiphilus albus]
MPSDTENRPEPLLALVRRSRIAPQPEPLLFFPEPDEHRDAPERPAVGDEHNPECQHAQHLTAHWLVGRPGPDQRTVTMPICPAVDADLFDTTRSF